MLGRILIVALLVIAVVAGGAIYYLQEYAFYEEIAAAGADDVRLTVPGGEVVPVAVTGFRAIDADSSPIRYRACFTLADDGPGLPDAVPYPRAEPLQGPRWFACYDAGSLGAALAEGRARAYLSVKDITWGVDRVVAIGDDGRGWAWHQINPCGEEVFDGNPAPEDCPPVPEGIARQ